ncbi:MAG: ATP-binding cassette domain-containing protein [Coriobacteriia bacterium]|nr:ATP-binding cassette domain-containing protein [Coriobacteriia bacterium]
MAGIEVEGLTVAYSGAKPVVAVRSLDLRVDGGEPVAVIGPSGCGKSSLLLALAGLVPPSAGAVRIGGEGVAGPRLRTALMLQDLGLLPWKTVEHNAGLGLEIRGVDAATRRTVVRAVLERLGLAEFARAFPAELSGGMRQRVALARALALDADVLLMDEPLSALDALTREDLQDLLLGLWLQRRHTQVLVTHSIEEAVFLGRRIVVMTPRPGRVAAILDNPEAGERSYRASETFLHRCVTLRRMLAEEGAFASTEVDEAGGER